ncbi:tRNA (adenosine(37)-N6)-threonylcarbamoyltransferase complex ATPase subunit type 1 TsaE [Candidatus Saccharibacteria bacterium]|nr:MAG: tRNA (adenosine(37)-N6)-threonylcarbamoyltransferase complex ATPase subunit type 1 TsaE [Candidatus Saccharibacteria bacterium]
MSTEKTWQTQSASSADTEALGERMGAVLKGGEVIELVSDLGGGKTTFTRGLVRGAGSSDHVSSPTFTISREYTAPKFTIVHFDFYRLTEPGIIADELREFMGDSNFVVVVEWGDIVQAVLPPNHIVINIHHSPHEGRNITCQYPSALKYIFAGDTQ